MFIGFCSQKTTPKHCEREANLLSNAKIHIVSLGNERHWPRCAQIALDHLHFIVLQKWHRPNEHRIVQGISCHLQIYVSLTILITIRSLLISLLFGNKPMLNPNSYAIITGKNQWGIQTDRDLQGTLTWTCLEPSLETFCLKPWNLLQRLLGTLIYLEHGNLFLEPLLAWNLHWKSLAWNLETLEPHASLSWNFWKFHLELA